MLRIRVDPNKDYPQVAWPRELITEGFTGEISILNDAITAVAIKPGVLLEQVKKSLLLHIQNVELRIEAEKDLKRIERN